MIIEWHGEYEVSANNGTVTIPTPTSHYPKTSGNTESYEDMEKEYERLKFLLGK